MTVKMIGLDIDGTLLDPRKRLTEPVREALEYAAARGVYIVPATGRPYLGIPLELREMDCIRYFISSNGASTWQGERLVMSRRFPAELCLKLLGALDGLYSVGEVFVEGQGFVSRKSYVNGERLYGSSSFLKYFRETRRIAEDLEGLIREAGELEELAVRCEKVEQCDRVLEVLKAFPEMKAARPTPVFLEIMWADAGKGNALEALGASLGLSPEEIMAIGDSDNDREMLMKAGIPVAMGNADEELKKLACYISADNSNHGVAQAIYEFIG